MNCKVFYFFFVSAAFFLNACGGVEESGAPVKVSRTVKFEFIQQSCGERIVAETSDTKVISAVRHELSKPFKQRSLHINGTIARGSSGINEPWTWHFVPDRWTLTPMSIEVCDACPSYVEDHLDKWLNEVGSFCPWGARVAGEINE